MPELHVELTDEERWLLRRAVQCSELLSAEAFVREAALAAARRRTLLADAVERVCDRSRPVLELIARDGDEAPTTRPERDEQPPVLSAPPLDEDEVCWAGREATGSTLSVFDQAATLLVGLATRAPFVRANRRAAWAAAMAFLDLSGFRFHSWGFDQDAAAQIVLDAAQGRADRDEVARRIRAIWLHDGQAGAGAAEAEER